MEVNRVEPLAVLLPSASTNSNTFAFEGGVGTAHGTIVATPSLRDGPLGASSQEANGPMALKLVAEAACPVWSWSTLVMKSVMMFQ